MARAFYCSFIGAPGAADTGRVGLGNFKHRGGVSQCQKTKTDQTRMARTALRLNERRREFMQRRRSAASAVSRWTSHTNIRIRCLLVSTTSFPSQRAATQATWIIYSLRTGHAIGKSLINYLAKQAPVKRAAFCLTESCHIHAIGAHIRAEDRKACSTSQA